MGEDENETTRFLFIVEEELATRSWLFLMIKLMYFFFLICYLFKVKNWFYVSFPIIIHIGLYVVPDEILKKKITLRSWLKKIQNFCGITLKNPTDWTEDEVLEWVNMKIKEHNLIETDYFRM